jgi:LacI family transcriptional regulator
MVRSAPFTAIVCANDRLAIGAIAALQRRGLRCPGDVSVTGFNDMPLAGRLQPPLTTVRVQHHKAGLQAAELMVEILSAAERPAPTTHLVLPVEMIVRGSTATAPGRR